MAFKKNYTKKSAKAPVRKYGRKPRKYVRKAPIYKQPRSDTNFLKVRVSAQIRFQDMLLSDDNSLYCNLLNALSQNISTSFNTNGFANLFYSDDFAKMQSLYRKYKTTCVVMKFRRPQTTLLLNNSVNFASPHVQPTVEWGTKVLHTQTVFQPNLVTNQVEANTNLQPRIRTTSPATWDSAIHDGTQHFKNHGYAKSVTRVWKPVGNFEKQWRYTASGASDQELAVGGLHLRMRDKNPTGMTSTPSFSYAPDQVLYDVEGIVYMSFLDRI